MFSGREHGLSRMRIAFFTETFLPKVDGIVTRLRFTVAELVRQGHEVLVFAPGSGCTEYGGARVVRIPGQRFPLYPELTVAFPRAFIRRELLAFQPDIIHTADPAALGIAGIYYSDVLHIPMVASYHTRLPKYVHYYGLGSLEPLVWKLMRFRHNSAQLNLCTSGAMVDELKHNGIQRVELWPPAVDTDLFHPGLRSEAMRARLSEGVSDCRLMIYVGRLSPEKNIERLKSVLDHVPNTRLAIVGGGPHRAALEKYFAGLPVSFVGYLHGEDLAAAVASSDALVLPSQTETLGLVLIEGMAAGTIVLGARAGGIPDIVSDGKTGFLFDPAKPDDLAVQMKQICSRTDVDLEQIRRQARQQAERWSWAEATSTLVGYYEDVLRLPLRDPRPNPAWKRIMKRVVMTGIRTALP